VTAQKASQKDYWNSRAEHFSDLSAPLIPGEQDIDFMKKYLPVNGNTLILGVTPQLCDSASGLSKTVTAVDFSEDMIKTLSRDGIKYVCTDWNQFFEQTTDTFDTILTDGGLTCIEYPLVWEQLAGNIIAHLREGGIFAVRAFLNTDKTPKDSYNNSNLNRLVAGMSHVDSNWMRQIDTHENYRDYDVRYAFPREQELLSTFGHLTLLEKFIPDYEEGEHFPSYAFKRTGV
jgi:SAM-dependent methyltransferase